MENIIILVSILIFSIIIHEIAHGLMALKLGDRTAENAGRLTLNPIPHIDLLGSIIVPLMLFLSGTNFLLGWAKPVPFNPNNLRDQKWGEAKVAIAGPASNIILAVLAIIIIYILMAFELLTQSIHSILEMAVIINLFLAFLNMLPVVPLDGSKILFSFLSHPKYLNLKRIMTKNQFLIIAIVLILLLTTNFLSYLVFGIAGLLL